MLEGLPMVSGRWTTQPAKVVFATVLIAACAHSISSSSQIPCEKPLYLTFGTGHRGIAPLVAEVLHRQQVQVTFFGPHERTQEGNGSLSAHWAPWWKARAAECHAFASHTLEHV